MRNQQFYAFFDNWCMRSIDDVHVTNKGQFNIDELLHGRGALISGHSGFKQLYHQLSQAI